MTHVSTPNTEVLPRQRNRRLGSTIGAIALVVATGAAIATGFALGNDEAAYVAPSGNTFTQAREGQPTPSLYDSADLAHLNRGPSSTPGVE